jgi:transcription elongation factor B subunit 1
VTFPEIPGAVLEKVCEYMHYKRQYAEAPAKAIPDFGLPPELALELLKASNFLDI